MRALILAARNHSGVAITNDPKPSRFAVKRGGKTFWHLHLAATNMQALVTRTYNPIPFQDLEPKRFEDLIRQLVYDFRPWRRLEATGRAGSDDGFDARGAEIVESPTTPSEPIDEAESSAAPNTGIPDRLWLVQCKRERTIGPAKLKDYLAAIVLSSHEALYGVIFAAACDFSKASRDAFFKWCREHGISEGHIWGRGELEDMLYQPKNDNLLFAYFGISLTIRRRSQATQLRAEIAMKQKLKRTILASSIEILVRDPGDTEYPNVAPGQRPTKWWVYRPEELTHYGLMLSVAWYYAYIDRATGTWDAADNVAAMQPRSPWQVTGAERDELDRVGAQAWHALPETDRAWLKRSGFIPIRNIVAVDEVGDDVFDGTHIYAPFAANRGPFENGFWERLETTSTWDNTSWEPDPAKRIVKFPANTRKVSPP